MNNNIPALKKLVIQIPCFNEADTLSVTLAALPREVPGVDVVEWLIIDDGCTDSTVDVARACGVDHIVSFPENRGLARAFEAGLDECIKAGADIIVNTDADNQYCAGDIPKLIEPIMSGNAEIVIGARPILQTSHFSPTKKVLQRLGSWFIRKASNTNIPDAPSGFRAFSRSAAQRLNVFGDYTYTLETIIQAGQKNMAITSVNIATNPDMRPSRLVKSIRAYVVNSLITAVRIFATYKPLRFFVTIGAGVFLIGFLIALRFLVFYFTGEGQGHVQSLILATTLLLIGFQVSLVGIVADLIAVNRTLLERIDCKLNSSPRSVAGQLRKEAGRQ